MPPARPVLGATLDGYACEGGYDTGEGPATSFSVAQAVGRCRPSLRSAGNFAHLDEVVSHLAALGLAEVRLTMEWARLEPRPGERDDDAFGAYARVLDAAGAAGLACDVLACDAVWPSWLGHEPWLSSWAPERFASHAAALASWLDGRARAIVTFRAPDAVATAGWLEGSRPPFRRRAREDATSALDGLLLAHQLATEAIATSTPAIRRALLVDAAAATTPALFALAAGQPATALARLPRSGTRWRAVPSFGCDLGGDDPVVLAAVLARLPGTPRVVELSAGARGWRLQLGAAGSVLVPRLAPSTPLHLYGALGSTGPLDAPVGLLDVEQRAGTWRLRGPRPDAAAALARLAGAGGPTQD